MSFQLRPYQQEAVDATAQHVRRSCSKPLIVLPTGAGKSLVCAEIARHIHQQSKGKGVLCLAPTAELVTQNRKKYMAYGYEASLFSASAGGKSTRHPVVFGSPGTVANSLERFGDLAAIIVDEAHGITATLLKIIEHLLQHNPRIRVIGLTATPYRLGTGYIYKTHYLNGVTDDSNARDPWWDEVVYELPAQYLIENGFLTPPAIGECPVSYSTSGLVQKGDKFTPESVAATFEGEERLTAAIVRNIVSQVEMGGYRSVMVFAATRDHAEEIGRLLPPGSWKAVYSDTPKSERKSILEDFVSGGFTYILNQNILTTGFDAPMVDVIAIMRATESPGLYQQIVGRGTRLCDKPYPDGRMKDHFLVLDYAENISRHFSETGDIFTPEIKARRPPEGTPFEVACPCCRFVNTFTSRPNPEELPIDDEGYFLDLEGNRLMIEVQEGRKGEEILVEKPMPAHFGRRCMNQVHAGALKELKRCDYMWSFKSCPECGAQNDIAARKCSCCGAEIVNPNDKLKEEAERLERDPHAIKQANIIGMVMSTTWTRKGDRALVISYETDHRQKQYQRMDEHYIPDHASSYPRAKWISASKSMFNGEIISIDEAIERQNSARVPKSITFQRKYGEKYPTIKRIEY